MKADKIILVPETHWDREWYLPFQEFRGELVRMMDKLLKILKTNPDYTNFTFDGQTIPIEDYLEVRPNREEEIKKYVEEGRLSIGPMYILPDEFLISGESLIRNLLIGHKIAKNFGKVMKAGYIPDPFGHIAQLPQILSGFEIPSVLFWRGFGKEFEENNLDMEFNWRAPGDAASILGIHLILSYGSLADIPTRKRNGEYKSALRKIRGTVSQMEKFTTTPYVLLNNGSDHHEAQPEIPEIIKQWNEQNPDKKIEQRDFEYYIDKVLDANPEMKSYEGELRGGRYAHLLSGVLSARMWIKQRNTAIEYLYEKYTEPLATMVWALDKENQFKYPQEYILTGLKWLIKNHPHDSICGCSIDEVHEEMKTRFDWAEQIGQEIIKDSISNLNRLINIDKAEKDLIPMIVYNPLPWNRRDIVEFTGITPSEDSGQFPAQFKLLDYKGNEIQYQGHLIEGEPRYLQESDVAKRFTFIADLPACGYKVYYINPNEKLNEDTNDFSSFKSTSDTLENSYYKVKIDKDGLISVLNKESGEWYKDICFFEDVGDWGDEYDFSGPDEDQDDKKFTSKDAELLDISLEVDGPTQKSFHIAMNLKLPHSLTENRGKRSEKLVDNNINLYISLYKGIKKIDFKIEVTNKSKDHRLRVLFPSKIKTEKVYADGHFYVVPREIELPEGENWIQKPLPTNHQKDFVSVSDDQTTFSVLNKGLPEYEAKKTEDGTITLAITLLRCVEWLSRDDFKTRRSHAGPELKTPGAQCIGSHTFELSIVIEDDKPNWRTAQVHKKGKEFNNPSLPLFPMMIDSSLRLMDKVFINPSGMLSLYLDSPEISRKSFLPKELSFLEIDNDAIMLSILKKSETGQHLIFRVYNISNQPQTGRVKFADQLKIKNAKLVNFLEEEPNDEIKATITHLNNNELEIKTEKNVIATIKIQFSAT